MTPEEIELVEHLGKAMSLFVKLPKLHTSDQQEFAYAVHLCQNIVFARVGMREYGWQEGGVLVRDEVE